MYGLVRSVPCPPCFAEFSFHGSSRQCSTEGFYLGYVSEDLSTMKIQRRVPLYLEGSVGMEVGEKEGRKMRDGERERL